MQELSQHGVLSSCVIKKTSKDQMKSSRNIMQNFEKTLQQKVENMFQVDGLKILVKKGKTFGLLTTRYYKIIQEHLYYFKSKTNNKKPKGILNLRDPSFRIELEYGKIIKEKQFGLRIQGLQTHGVFWLVSSNQAENVMLFKYLKLLSGQFQIKQLPLISNRNTKGAFNNSIMNNNSAYSQVDGIENMISEEKIHQIDALDASLNLALRNVDSSIVMRKENTNAEENYHSIAQQNSPFQMYSNKVQRKEYFNKEDEDHQQISRIDFILNNEGVNNPDFQRSNARSIGTNDIVSTIRDNYQPQMERPKKSDFILKKSDNENELIFDEEEEFKNKECGSIQYHNSSTYFGGGVGKDQKQLVNGLHSQTYQNQSNQISINYNTQSEREGTFQVDNFNTQFSPQKKHPHTTNSLEQKNDGNSGNKSNFQYQIRYSPNYSNIYGIGYDDDEFFQRGIGDVQLPPSPDKIRKYDEDYDDEYIEYYGGVNLNYLSNQEQGISSYNTLNSINQIKKPLMEIVSQNQQSQQSLSNIKNNQIQDKSKFSTSILSNNILNQSKILSSLNPVSQSGGIDDQVGFQDHDDYALQLNIIKEQGKKIEESINTQQQILNQYKMIYEQIKKSMTCIDDEQGEENKVINQTTLEKDRSILTFRNLNQYNPTKLTQRSQLSPTRLSSQKLLESINPNQINERAKFIHGPQHNHSKSETQIGFYSTYIDNYYEDINLEIQGFEMPFQLSHNEYQSQTTRQIVKNIDGRERNNSAPQSPNQPISYKNVMKFINPDENIIEDSEDEGLEQNNKRQQCRNMEIVSNYNPQHRSQTDLAMEIEDDDEENDDEYEIDNESGLENEEYLSEKPQEQFYKSNRFNEIKEIKYQSGLSNKTTTSQSSDKIFQQEQQKQTYKEIKDNCNSESSIKKIDDLDCRIVDEIKDEVGRSSTKLNRQNPFNYNIYPNVRRNQNSVSQPFLGQNNFNFKSRASEKNISQQYILDECKENKLVYEEDLDESVPSVVTQNPQNIINTYPYQQDEIIQNTPPSQNGKVQKDSKDSIQIDSFGRVIKQANNTYQSISQSSSSSPSVSPQQRSSSPSTNRKKIDLQQNNIQTNQNQNLKQATIICDEQKSSQGNSSPSQRTPQRQRKVESASKKSKDSHQNNVFVFTDIDKKLSEQKLKSNNIYTCLEEVCSMLWRNFFREAQREVKELRQRFTKKRFLIEIVDLEIDLLITCFSGQTDSLNLICEKVDSILKMIKLEQKQKQNFYDLCLCDINQAELFLVKESKLIDSLRSNTVYSQSTPIKKKDDKGYQIPDNAIDSSKIQQILNKFYFGKGFFATAFSFLPDGILSFLKFLGYSNENNIGIKWLEKCIQEKTLRSNYATILLSLYYVERKNENQKGLDMINQAQIENKGIDGICFSWVKSLILMNLEEAEQAEKCLLRGILNVNDNIQKHHLQPISLNIIMYELCWLEIIQMKWSLSLSHLEEIICKSLDLQIFKSTSKAIKKSDIQYIKIIEEKAKQIQKQQKMSIPLKLHMIMHLACCFVDVGEEQMARAYLQLIIFEYNLMSSQKKSHDDIVKLTEKYLNRPSILFIQYEAHYLLKQTSKLSDTLLLKNRPYIKQQLKSIIKQENTALIIPQKISLCTFLAVINCFIGKNNENEDIYEIFEDMKESQLKPYSYILQHFYFWCAMSFFHRKMYQKSLLVFEKAKKIKNTEFSILEKVEKNITQLQTYIEKEKQRLKTQESNRS